MRVFIGTYPAPQKDGQEDLQEGIWQANFDLDSATFSDLTQVLAVASPSFIAVTPDHGALFAVSETDEGQLHRYAITPQGLNHEHSVPTFGAAPCHVAVAVDHVIAANYGSGSVASYRKEQDRSELMDGKQFQQSGQGPLKDRQDGPHAHFVGQVPASQHVWVSDLGADRIFGYQIAGDGSGVRHLVARGTAVEMPAGSGPRHIAFDGAGYAFVVGELNNTLYTVRVDSGTGLGEVVAELNLDSDQNQAQEQWPSHIELNPDGSLLIAAVRGSDTLHIFKVDRSQDQVPQLIPAGVVPTGGAWPRHFKSFGQRADGLEIIAVANQFSDSLDVVGFDQATGVGQHLSSTKIRVPACIVALQ